MLGEAEYDKLSTESQSTTKSFKWTVAWDDKSYATYALLAMESLEERYTWVLDHVKNLQMRIDLLSPFRREGVDPQQLRMQRV